MDHVGAVGHVGAVCHVGVSHRCTAAPPEQLRVQCVSVSPVSFRDLLVEVPDPGPDVTSLNLNLIAARGVDPGIQVAAWLYGTTGNCRGALAGGQGAAADDGLPTP